MGFLFLSLHKVREDSWKAGVYLQYGLCVTSGVRAAWLWEPQAAGGPGWEDWVQTSHTGRAVSPTQQKDNTLGESSSHEHPQGGKKAPPVAMATPQQERSFLSAISTITDRVNGGASYDIEESYTYTTQTPVPS